MNVDLTALSSGVVAGADGRGMLLLVNGPCGVGKSSLGWMLLDTLHGAVLLDGDAFGAVNPYRVDDARRSTHLQNTLALVIRHHRAHGYRHFIIPTVTTGPGWAAALQEALAPEDFAVWKFRLTASEAAVRRRILGRNSVDCAWELRRFATLQENFAGPWYDPEEIVLDSTDASAAELVFLLKSRLFDAAPTPNEGRAPSSPALQGV